MNPTHIPTYLLPGVTEAFRILDEELYPKFRQALGLLHHLARITTEQWFEEPQSVEAISLATDQLLAEALVVWQKIPESAQATPEAIKLRIVVEAYARARRELVKADPPEPPDGGGLPGLEHKPSPYPIEWTDKHGTTGNIAQAINAREVHETDAAVIVFAKAGRIDGFTIGDGGWTPTPSAKPWWNPAKTLVIVAHPDGTTLKGLPRVWSEEKQKWEWYGSTVELKDGGDWDGRVHVAGFSVEASGSNCFQIGAYGASTLRYMEDVRVVNCRLAPNPDPDIRPIRPISANQCDLAVPGTTCHIPNAYEHFVYTRNCRNVSGDNCFVSATGGQVFQDVGRPKEGPYLGKGTMTISGLVAHNFHRDPSRAGSGLTFAGGNKDVVVENCIVWDNPDEDSDRDFGYGLQATWDGGYDNHYNLPSGRANGHITLRDCLFLSVNPNRNPIKFHDCEGVTMERCGFYWGANRHIDIHDNAGEWTATGCNTPEIREKARELMLAAGMEDHLHILDTDPPVRLIDHGEILKPISEY